jgi:hypothetical protein
MYLLLVTADWQHWEYYTRKSDPSLLRNRKGAGRLLEQCLPISTREGNMWRKTQHHGMRALPSSVAMVALSVPNPYERGYEWEGSAYRNAAPQKLKPSFFDFLWV